MARIVIINPKFEASFWGLEHALELLGVKANVPVAALPLLAALTPVAHTVELIDENVEPMWSAAHGSPCRRTTSIRMQM
jgi:hypothetical protein